MKMASTSPLVSVIVPVKNEEDAIDIFIARVGGVLDALNEPDGWEILFVDDGSTDATLAKMMLSPTGSMRACAASRFRATSARRRH
jgi:hypothetical protein